MVAFMHTGTRLTAGYRYTTLGDATEFDFRRVLMRNVSTVNNFRYTIFSCL